MSDLPNGMHPTGLLALWSAPRSRSTAFLRMMAQRGDHIVLHEPFSHVADFGRTVVGGREVRSEPELIAALTAAGRTGRVFFKDTTDFRYPHVLADERFLRGATHTFIIRRPEAVLASCYALVEDLRCQDVGIERLFEIFAAVDALTGRPVVISSDDLVERPDATVRAYCAAVGIPFRPEALRWPAGVLPEWRSTLRWHERTSRTDGFVSTPATYRDTVANNDVLARYYRHHLPFYERLYAARLRVAA
jgi:hypothetical protein